MMRIGAIPLAILVAWMFACGVAFQPSRHYDPNKFHDDFFQRDGRRQHRSFSSQLFGRPPTEPSTIASNREYLSQTLGISEEKLGTLSRNGSWNILTLEIGVLEGRVDWLTKRLNLKESEMKKIAQKQPLTLGRQPGTMLEKLDYLQTRLLLDENSLRKLILTAPTVLGCPIEDSIEPKLYWLQQRLDLDATAVSKMIQRLPALFHYSVDDNIEPKLEWLQHHLDLDDAALSKMVQRLPALFCYSVDDNLDPKLEWLRQHLDLDDSAVKTMVQQFPALLSYSVDSNLNPTLEFYIDALGAKEEAVALVVRNPALLSRSLEKRLKPRLEDARKAGIQIDAGCLSRIAKYTNDMWHTSLLFQMKKSQNGFVQNKA